MISDMPLIHDINQIGSKIKHDELLERIKFLSERITELQERGTELVLANRTLKAENERLRGMVPPKIFDRRFND